MATIRSLQQIPALLLYGWLLTIIFLMIFPMISDQVQWGLYGSSFVQDVGGDWAADDARVFWNMIYLVCWLPGGLGTAAALYQSTRKQEYHDVSEYQYDMSDNQFANVEEYQ